MLQRLRNLFFVSDSAAFTCTFDALHSAMERLGFSCTNILHDPYKNFQFTYATPGIVGLNNAFQVFYTSPARS